LVEALCYKLEGYRFISPVMGIALLYFICIMDVQPTAMKDKKKFWEEVIEYCFFTTNYV
jgi:hypothetical protein